MVQACVSTLISSRHHRILQRDNVNFVQQHHQVATEQDISRRSSAGTPNCVQYILAPHLDLGGVELPLLVVAWRMQSVPLYTHSRHDTQVSIPHLDLGGVELPLLVVVQRVHVDTAGDEDIAAHLCDRLQRALDAVEDLLHHAWAQLH